MIRHKKGIFVAKDNIIYIFLTLISHYSPCVLLILRVCLVFL